MTKPTSGEELAETAAASPTGSTAPGHGGAGAAAVLGPRELAPGDTMERYEIVGVLGAGGMGRVYRARDPDLNRDVAIKVLRRTEAGSAGGLERRLLREAQAMAKLTHPNLATVFDVGTVDGEVFIAFEFIDGQTLGAWARAGRSVDDRRAALVAAGRGLEAAHSAGVVHRDFKPDNVLVGRDGAVKVVDFGLARGLGEARVDPADASQRDELAVDLTVTGSILGTPAYMAPEQHHGNVADARADQFGFAVSAWEVLYGERPFRGATFTALATAICEGQIAPPPSTTGVPPAMETVLRKALSVDPEKRYPDMGALLAALAPPPSNLAAPRSSVWGGWRTALVAFVVACMAMGGVYVGYVTNRVDPKRAVAVVDAGPPVVPESNDAFRTAVNDLVRTERPHLDECYDTAQAKAPQLGAGSVKMNFEIANTGRVVSSRIFADDFGGEHGIASCVAGLTMGWTFPTPPGGAGASLSLKFDFEPRLNEITRDGDTVTISRATWDSWNASPGYLSRGIKPVKSEANGKQIGYRLFGIQPGSIQNQLGFEAGDMVTHINDHPLESERAFVDVAHELDGSKPIAIRLDRRGTPLTLTFRIAPTPN